MGGDLRADPPQFKVEGDCTRSFMRNAEIMLPLSEVQRPLQ